MSANSNLMQVLSMLVYQQSISSSELEEKLGVNRRTIRTYISSLKSAGLPILATGGQHSRYILSDNHCFGRLSLSSEEVEALNAAQNRLLLENGYIYEETFRNLLHRIKQKAQVIVNPAGIPITEKVVEDPNRDKTRHWLSIICSSIHENRKLEMVYPDSQNGGFSKRVVCPFGLHNSENENYLLAHCETRNDLREFNIKRIKSLVSIEEYFPSSMRGAIKNHFENSIGAFGGTPFKIKLCVKPPFARVLQERIYVKNQKLTVKDDGSVIFEARISGRPDVVRWILGMGFSCEVLEPEDLRDEIRSILEKALNQYKKEEIRIK